MPSLTKATTTFCFSTSETRVFILKSSKNETPMRSRQAVRTLIEESDILLFVTRLRKPIFVRYEVLSPPEEPERPFFFFALDFAVLFAIVFTLLFELCLNLCVGGRNFGACIGGGTFNAAYGSRSFRLSGRGFKL